MTPRGRLTDWFSSTGWDRRAFLSCLQKIVRPAGLPSVESHPDEDVFYGTFVDLLGNDIDRPNTIAIFRALATKFPGHRDYLHALASQLMAQHGSAIDFGSAIPTSPRMDNTALLRAEEEWPSSDAGEKTTDVASMQNNGLEGTSQDPSKTLPSFRIDRELLTAIEHDINSDEPQIINLFGPSGHGKSEILFSLRLRLRSSSTFLDCLLEPFAEISAEELALHIRDRTGGSRTPKASLGRDTLPSLEESRARLPVFMIDDFDRFSLSYRSYLLNYLRLRSPGAVIVCSRAEIRLTMPRLAIPWRCHFVSVYSTAEARAYLAHKLPEKVAGEAAGMLVTDAHRHPVAVRALLRGLLQSHEGNIVGAIRSASEELVLLIRHELDELLRKHGVRSDALFELTAPRYLTARLLSSLQIVPNVAQADALLEDLFHQSFLIRHRPRYWWRRFFSDSLRHIQRPSHTTYATLVSLALASPDLNLQDAKYALVYVERAKFAKAEERRGCLKLLSKLEAHLPDYYVFPVDSDLEDRLATLAETGDDCAQRLYSRYLECRGSYDRALSNVAGTSGRRADEIRLQLLDKKGEFGRMAELIVDRTRDAALPIAHEPWTAKLTYFHGRAQQGAGSLSSALRSYSVVEEFPDPPISVRARAFIERATIWVFAEEPARALNVLNEAKALLADTDYTRGHADVRRYEARAHKLRACQTSGHVQRKALAAAELCTHQLLQISAKISYTEGLIWHKVLTSRLAYAQGSLEEALSIANEAYRMLQQHRYYGGIPHLLRHRALIHACAQRVAEAHRDLDHAGSIAQTSKRIYLLALLADTRAKILIIEDKRVESLSALREAKSWYKKCELFDEPFVVLKKRIEAMERDPASLRARSPVW